MALTCYSDWDAETLESGGKPLAGKCHLLVTTVDESQAESKSRITVICSTLAHEKPGQEGKKVYVYMNLTGKGSRRPILFAMATGILSQEEWVASKAAGKSIDIPYTDARGRTFFTELSPQKSDNPKFDGRVDIGFDFFAPGSPSAEGFPADNSYLPKSAVAAGAGAGDDEVPF
jgi:hypothetical protein